MYCLFEKTEEAGVGPFLKKLTDYQLLTFDVRGEVSSDEKDDDHDDQGEEDDGLLEQGHAHLKVDHLGAAVERVGSGAPSCRHFEHLELLGPILQDLWTIF